MRAVLFLFALLWLPPSARAVEYAITPGAPNRVVFVSKAPTETFEGTTDRLSGSIQLDPDAPGDSITVRIEVDLASLDTGIGKRNQHMRENHLETDRFPVATFTGAAILSRSAASLAEGKTITFELEGAFTLHGVTRRLRVPVDVTRRDANTLEFETSFPVLLADYEISRPRFLFMKLGEVQNVTVHGVAVARP
ncbi:MAG TPA: YceI family protein [Candidatus Krumholzibacteria bacterium]|nr:YceI family protein [Candidatus Krumholzibacteria bacterium]